MVFVCKQCNRVCLLEDFYFQHQILHNLQEQQAANDNINKNGISTEIDPLLTESSTSIDTCHNVLPQGEARAEQSKQLSTPSDSPDIICIDEDESRETISDRDTISAPCTVCSKTYTYPTKWMDHLFTHYDEYFCSICYRKFLNAGQYEIHCISHKTVSSEKIFECSKCGAFFIHQKVLKEHESICHKNHKLLACTQCPVIYLYNSLYQHHILCHIKKSLKMCMKCGLSFDEQEPLQIHMKNHGKDAIDKLFQCFTCAICFTDQMKLMYHIFILHNGKKPILCVSCSKINFQCIVGQLCLNCKKPLEM